MKRITEIRTDLKKVQNAHDSKNCSCSCTGVSIYDNSAKWEKH